MVEILDTIPSLRTWREDCRRQGKIVAFVPTMGALHEGHLKLVQEGQRHCDICLPYIFVNPKQFAPHEDLDKYPRTLEKDLEKLASIGVSHVYVPQAQEIYPDSFQTIVSVSDITQPLEGEFRPHFFHGVTTIVCKMLLQTLPDIALFGEKDFQQLQVIKRMVMDLNIPVTIQGVPTVRDKNGLALSSRNAYLSAEEYKIAIHLNKILRDLADSKISEEEACNSLLNHGFDRVDYCVKRNSQNFKSENPDRVLTAVWLGKTRLIDNMAL